MYNEYRADATSDSKLMPPKFPGAEAGSSDAAGDYDDEDEGSQGRLSRNAAKFRGGSAADLVKSVKKSGSTSGKPGSNLANSTSFSSERDNMLKKK